MNQKLPSSFVVSNEVAYAIKNSLPVVALESAVITHGLPRPENLQLAEALEHEVRDAGAVPATIALLDGKIHLGLSAEELYRLANEDGARKVSRRDFSLALARKENGGTTVAATLYAAHAARIRVFATGGIGGVHRGSPFDISADLSELGRTPLVVICAGAKAILDLPATLEVLETEGVTVIGYGTDEFPAFYSRSSGLPVNLRVNSPEEVAQIAREQWQLGLESALLVVQPPPIEMSLPADQVEVWIQEAIQEAHQEKIIGAEVTPYLLTRMSQLSGGASLQANLALLRNNACLAAKIALAIQPRNYF